MNSLPTPDERVYDELHELLEIPDGASYKEFARRIRRLYSKHEAVMWARVRFERGKRNGAYPALTEYLSGLSDEEQDTFFRTGGLRSVLPLEEIPEKPWDGDPYHGNAEEYREDLHDGIYTSGDPEDLPHLAVEWLEELARTGYRGRSFAYGNGVVLQLPARRKTTSEAVPQLLRLGWKAGPVFFSKANEVLGLELDADRSGRGHREIKLNDDPLRPDASILAALITTTCHPLSGLASKRQNFKGWREVARGFLRELPEPFERPFRQRVLELHKAGHWVDYRTLDFAMMLLRYHKPYFDDLSEADRIELLGRMYAHIQQFLGALRGVTSFLDYGAPGRQLRSAKGEAEKHIEAAILKHVYEMSNTEIAREMGQFIAGEQKAKNDPATVRQWVRLGTQLLERTMGKDHWWAHVKAMKAEAERWNALTEEEQEAEAFLERYAEARRIRLDFARQDIEEGYDPPNLTGYQAWLLKEAREAHRDAKKGLCF